MAPGSVIVDLAAERGGNCELTAAGRDAWSSTASPSSAGSTWPAPSPTTPARCTRENLTAFLLHLVKDGKLRLNLDDEIIRDTLLTRGGEVVNARVREFFALPAIAAHAEGARRMKHRPDHEPLRVHAGGVHRLRGDPPGFAAAPHAADVADQRARRDRGGRRDHPGRRSARARWRRCSARSRSSRPRATSWAGS